MIAIIPILVMLIMAILVVSIGFGRIFKRRSTPVISKGRLAYSQRVRLLFSIYTLVLLVCMIISNLVPFNNMTELEESNSKKLERDSTALYEAAVNGTIAEKGKDFLRKNWEFPFDGKSFKLALAEDSYFNFTIVIERKLSNDGQIDASFYMAGSEVNGLNLTTLIQPPLLEVQEQKLLLSNSPENDLKFSQFVNVFPIRQFSGERLFGGDQPTSEGTSILYLTIPKDLDVENPEEVNVQYVNKR
ncbi:hypothetical protein [Bacillus rubiinfantis]|uniref:hypothetical protein n=1 Tax=Bacillus rubiinfantis TaxID=1499680 RepID=UPI0005AA95C1|nr:hypothetical protein [Bacillus rubiinfantis]